VVSEKMTFEPQDSVEELIKILTGINHAELKRAPAHTARKENVVYDHRK